MNNLVKKWLSSRGSILPNHTLGTIESLICGEKHAKKSVYIADPEQVRNINNQQQY